MYCDKVSYPDAGAAKKAAGLMSEGTGEKMSEYKCERCGGYHLTSGDSGYKLLRPARKIKYPIDVLNVKKNKKLPKFKVLRGAKRKGSSDHF